MQGHGFYPSSRKIPHASEQLSPCAIIAEPACVGLVLWNKRILHNEKPERHSEE